MGRSVWSVKATGMRVFRARATKTQASAQAARLCVVKLDDFVNKKRQEGETASKRTFVHAAPGAFNPGRLQHPAGVSESTAE